MKKLLVFLSLFLLSSVVGVAQTIGSTKTEDFKADFEKKRDISAYMDYEGPQIPIQILKFDLLLLLCLLTSIGQ